MSRIHRICLLVFLPILTLANPSHEIRFHEGELETLASQAEREGKLLFIQFTADDCSPCQWLDQNTFSDPKLAQLLSTRYLPVRWKGDSPKFTKYLRQFEVDVIPSMLVVSPNGAEMVRLVETMSSSKLIQYLVSLPAKPVETNRSVLVRPSIRPHAARDKMAGYAHTPAPNRYQSLRYNPGVAHGPNLSNTSSTPNAALLPAPKFILQMGVYTNLPSVERRMGELERIRPGQVHLYVDKIRGHTYYKVVLGYFANEREAIRFWRELPARWRKKELVKNIDNL